MKRVLVPLADGFEEIEAISVVDVLRRAGLSVTVAGVAGSKARGAHGIIVHCDANLDQTPERGWDAVVLPGGIPGTPNLASSGAVEVRVRGAVEAGGLVAAICAAPTILDDMGLLEGRLATAHSAHRHQMARCRLVEDPVVVDGPVVTGCGAGVAVEFAATIVECLVSPETAKKILDAIEFPR